MVMTTVVLLTVGAPATIELNSSGRMRTSERRRIVGARAVVTLLFVSTGQELLLVVRCAEARAVVSVLSCCGRVSSARALNDEPTRAFDTIGDGTSLTFKQTQRPGRVGARRYSESSTQQRNR